MGEMAAVLERTVPCNTGLPSASWFMGLTLHLAKSALAFFADGTATMTIMHKFLFNKPFMFCNYAHEFHVKTNLERALNTCGSNAHRIEQC